MTQIMQMSHQTSADRFPKIFTSIKEMYPNPKRILSFGCSQGDEVFTLKEKYFPEAEIVGVDIDYWTIQQARNSLKTKKYKDIFFHTDLGATGKYDIIFCLMTLFSMDNPVTKEISDSAMTLLDTYLNLNGLLIIYTADHNFVEHLAAKNYEVIRHWVRKHNVNSKDYFCGYYKKLRDTEY